MAAAGPPKGEAPLMSGLLTSPGPSSKAASPTRCWVFDFDWTVVDENSDTWIHRCAQGGALPPDVKDSYVSPDWIGYMNRVLHFLAQQGVTAEDLRKQLQAIPWTPGMRQLLEAIMESNSDAAPAESTALAAEPALTPEQASTFPGHAGDDRLAHSTAAFPGPFRQPQHAIILSDANSLFIPWILDGGSDDGGGGAVEGRDGGVCGSASGSSSGRVTSQPAAGSPGATLDAAQCTGPGVPVARPDQGASGLPRSPPNPRPLTGMFLRILTNPAAVDPVASAAVVVSPHNGPGPDSYAPPHSCARCHPNLCKRTALRKFLDEQTEHGLSYKQIVYVGDGRNDLCPCLGLGSGDVVMPRVGFALHKLLGSVKPPPVAGTESAGEQGQGAGQGGDGGTNGSSHRGDDTIYVGLGGKAETTEGGQGPTGSSQHGGKVAGAGRGGGEVLRAACVPWNDAYDILRWVRAQEEQEGLTERAGALAL